MYRRPVLLHALKDDARVQRRSFNGREELVLCRVHKIPAERHTAEIGIDQDGSVAIVPDHA
jgi:hypothetical protein